MTSTIEVEGLGPILAKLRELEQTAKYVQPVLQQIGKEIINEAGQYPAAFVPTYKRTLRLKRGWVAEARADELTVSNAVPYGPYVHGDNDQVWFHAMRGWKTLGLTAQEMMPRLIEGLRAQLRRIIG